MVIRFQIKKHVINRNCNIIMRLFKNIPAIPHAVMRHITLIILHCSAVRPGQTSSAAQIDTWHRQRGWKLGIGYHYVVRRDGQIEAGRPEYMVGAHCLNHNAHSIGVCYEGGLDIRGQPDD